MSEDIKNEEQGQEQPAKETPNQEPKEKKPPLKVGGKLMGIIPQDLDEAWRLVEAMYRAGMTPNS